MGRADAAPVPQRPPWRRFAGSRALEHGGVGCALERGDLSADIQT